MNKTKLISWDEEYRPKDYEDFIDEIGIIPRIERMFKSGVLKHFLFSGTAGTGKTTFSEILAKKWLEHVGKGKQGFSPSSIKRFNASDDRGIDVVRNKIKKIVRASGSFVIILDEADAMTDDAQTALRRLMEQAKKKTSPKLFIITCNYPWKIIEPLHSRCENFEFTKISKEGVTKRLEQIVNKEKVSDFVFEAGILTPEEKTHEIKMFFEYIFFLSEGDLRSAISTCQEFVVYDEERDIKVLDFTLRNKIEASLKTNIEILMEQIYNDDHPTFENVYSYVDNMKKNHVYIKKVFRDMIYWISSKTKKRELGDLIGKHMAVSVAKYEARVQKRSDVDIQFSALISELSLIKMTGNYLEND